MKVGLEKLAVFGFLNRRTSEQVHYWSKVAVVYSAFHWCQN